MNATSKVSPEKQQMDEIKALAKNLKELNEEYYKEAIEIVAKSNRLVNQTYRLYSMRFGPYNNSFFRIR